MFHLTCLHVNKNFQPCLDWKWDLECRRCCSRPSQVEQANRALLCPLCRCCFFGCLPPVPPFPCSGSMPWQGADWCAEVQLCEPREQLSAHEDAPQDPGPPVCRVLHRLRSLGPQDLHSESRKPLLLLVLVRCRVSGLHVCKCNLHGELPTYLSIVFYKWTLLALIFSVKPLGLPFDFTCGWVECAEQAFWGRVICFHSFKLLLCQFPFDLFLCIINLDELSRMTVFCLLYSKGYLRVRCDRRLDFIKTSCYS